MSHLPKDTCLQCEQTREEVKRNDTICGIEGGYECIELIAEWDRHHWRDWSDTELLSFGILPKFFDQHRRDSASSMECAPCEHTKYGHSYAGPTDIDLGIPADECIRCGHNKPADHHARTTKNGDA